MPIKLDNSLSASSLRNITNSNNRMGDLLSKMGSGQRITKAADDAAALVVATQLSSDIASVDQAQRNISDGMSMTRVAESGMNQISDLLQRGRELSVQAASGTVNDSQRATLNQEITSIKEEINRTTGVTEFNGQKLLDGSMAPGAQTQTSVQAGINNTSSDRLSMNVIDKMDTQSLGVDDVDISTQKGAQDALSSFDTAIKQVSDSRSAIGSLQNRFDAAAKNAAATSENLTAAKSNIADLDYAQATSDMAREQVLSQAGSAALRQGVSAQASSVGALLNVRA